MEVLPVIAGLTLVLLTIRPPFAGNSGFEAAFFKAVFRVVVVHLLNPLVQWFIGFVSIEER